MEEREAAKDRAPGNDSQKLHGQERDFTDTQIHQVLAPITSLAKALTVDPEAESRDLAVENNRRETEA